MVMQFKTKPIIVEAIEWKGNYEEMEEFGLFVNLDSLEHGSWIVKTVKGKFVVYTKEQFWNHHERHLVWEENI